MNSEWDLHFIFHINAQKEHDPTTELLLQIAPLVFKFPIGRLCNI